MKKVVFVLIDGLADLSIPSIDFKTPLEHSNTPNMDKIALNGLNGFDLTHSNKFNGSY
jgi:2,3-bisphosphoglycerate-independent phosphoglycerate mutase